MLTLDNIACCKNQELVFKNLGFSVGLGSGLILQGSNGSGKTTLLKVIAGLCQPRFGEILWNNENIKPFRQQFSASINYIGHKKFLKNQLTVKQNLTFYAKLSQTEILLASAFKYFSLEKFLDKPIYQLSSGWQKKVMLAKLLCCPATIWLLDEPTVNLDQTSAELLFNLVSIKIKDGGIVIIASHDDIFNTIASKICLEDFRHC